MPGGCTSERTNAQATPPRAPAVPVPAGRYGHHDSTSSPSQISNDRIGRRMLDNPAPLVEHRLPPSPASRSSPPKERPERVGRNPQNVACNMSRRPAKPSPSPPRECLPSRPGRPFTARSTHSKGSARTNPRRSPLPMSSRATTAHLDASAASPYPRADAPVRELGCFLIACARLIAGPVPTVTGGSQSPRRCGRSALDPLAGACFPGRLGQE